MKWSDRYINDKRIWTHEHRPDYAQEYVRRAKLYDILRSDPVERADALTHYRNSPVDFILDWITTYDPRNASRGLPTTMPFCMFPRQIDYVQFLYECVQDEEGGMVEKCRDMGASYVTLGFAVWAWLFMPGMAIGVGSRKEILVDRIGDPDSLLEKVRMMIDLLPRDIFWPKGFKAKEHMPSMKILNPANGAIISGEAGDNIGRGGRKMLYIKDEAQPLDAKILTPTGWSTMGEMRVGSKVIGVNGKALNVTHINQCGEHNVYRVIFSDGTSTEASENHLWALKGLGAKKPKTITTKRLFETYRQEYASGQYHFKYRNLLTAPVEFQSTGELPLHPYVTGVFLGDGSIKHVPKYRPKFTSIDPEIVEEVIKLIPSDTVVVSCKNGKDHRYGDAQGKRGRFKVSRASQSLIDAEIADFGAEDKHIPNRYKFASVQDRLALLQGLMDTDGSASNKGYPTFHTCSKQLADDVRFIVQSLGGTANLNVRPDHRGFRDMYVIYMVLPDDMIPFRLPRKINAMVKRKCQANKKVVNVEYVGVKPVQCITVDSPDGLYLTDHCIVTHNSAHYERPELIEAALGDNTNVPIDISSVNGPGNVFHRRRLAGEVWEPGKRMTPGKTRVFIMDWRDHPAKDQAWYDARRQRAEEEGLLHKFAQEVDRDYNSAVEGVLIPSAWVQAAVNAHERLDYWEPSGMWIAGQDVADSGGDVNALVIAQGTIVRYTEKDGREVDHAIPSMMLTATMMGVKVYQYEVTGVGTAPKVAARQYDRFEAIPWSPTAKVVNPNADDIAGTEPGEPDRMTNRDYFRDANAQAAWNLRLRFQRTYKAVVLGERYDPEDMVSIPADDYELIQELSQPTYSSTPKITIDKKPNGAKSPNKFDALKICFAPRQRRVVALEYGVENSSAVPVTAGAPELMF